MMTKTGFSFDDISWCFTWAFYAYLVMYGVLPMIDRMVKSVWRKEHEKDCIWYGKQSLPCACPRRAVGGCVPFIADEDAVVLNDKQE